MSGNKVSTARSSMIILTVVVLVYIGLIFSVRQMFPMSVFVLGIILGFIALGLSLKSLFGERSQCSEDDQQREQ